MAKEDETQSIMEDLEKQWTPEHSNAGTMAAKEGDAVLRCENGFVNRSQKGRKQLNFSCIILEHATDPGSVGSKVTVRFGIEKIEDLKRLNQSLVNLGLEIVKSAKDVLRVAREIQGVCFNGKIVPQEDSQFPPNVYINPGARRRDREEGGDTAAAPQAGGPADKF